MTVSLGAREPRLTLSIVLIAAIFVGGGVLHLVKPEAYLSMMPPWLPAGK